jgi:hypothetical protein
MDSVWMGRDEPRADDDHVLAGDDHPSGVMVGCSQALLKAGDSRRTP